MESQENFWMKTSSGFADLQPSLIEESPVGPGQYTLQSFIPSGPSYSFPQASRFMTPPKKLAYSFLSQTPEKCDNLSQIQRRNRSSSPKSFIEDSPGPGAYDLPSTLANKKVSIGGKYKEDPPNNYPGPGSYDIELKPNLGFPEFRDARMKDRESVTSKVEFVYSEFKSSSPCYSIGKKNRSASQPNIPGPGSYDLKSTLLNKTFTICPKREPVQGLNTPGPGSYSADVRKSAPVFSMGLPLNQPQPLDVPGPGQYSYELKPSGPVYSMGTRFREKEEEDNRDLGSIKSSLGSHGAIMLGKYKDIPDNKVPGPGSYSPEKPKSKQSLALSLSSRDVKPKDGPGPGEYSPERLKSDAPSYSIGKRLSPPKPNDFPAPGHYETPPKSVQAPLLRGKPKDLPISNFPGPCEYSPSRLHSSQAYSQSRSNRFQDIDLSPGPGEYSPELRRSGPKYTMGVRTSSGNLEESPGPAAYDPTLMPSKSSVTLRGKPKDPTPAQIPGPGSYNTESKLGNKGYSQGKSGREDFTKSFKYNPGPGTYDSDLNKTTGYSFPKEKRELSSRESSPGPGSYDCKFIDRSIKTMLRGKPSPERSSKTPGPGSYSTERINRSPSYTFGQKSQSNFENGVPGVGTYDYNHRSDSPSWTMAERRERNKAEKIPGPGAYDPKLRSSLVTYTFGQKREQEIEKTPGPGEYDLINIKSSGISFGQRLKEKLNQYPGPGSYNPKLRSSNPSWTMQSRKSSKPIEDLPGPGQYTLNMSSSTQAFSFSKLGRKSTPSKTPAPTDYSPEKSSLKDSISYSCGKSGRIDFTKLKTKTPGPGSYYKQAQVKALSGKFSMAKRESKFVSDTKAPYLKIEQKPLGPFYSMSGKRKERKAEKTPGPGAYQNDLKFKPASPAYSFSYRTKSRR